MSDNLPAIPQGPQRSLGPTSDFDSWAGAGGDGFGEEPEGGISWRRYVSAVVRQKWLIGLTFLLGAIASAGVWVLIQPEFEAEATLWIQQDDQSAAGRGPIRSGNLLQQYAWVDLLQSPPVLVPVVMSERLFVEALNPADSLALLGFDVRDRPAAGEYRLAVDRGGDRYVLTRANGDIVEEGQVGDSIGVPLGFHWRPRTSVLNAGRTLDFRVINPGGAARRLAQQLTPRLPAPGSFLYLSLRGRDPTRIARVVNSVADEHTRTAEQLKRKQADDLAAALLAQRDNVYQDLRAAEFNLEEFRIATITLPDDRTIPIAPGLQATTSPAFSDFFQKQIRQEEIRDDVARMEAALALGATTGAAFPIEAMEIIPAAQKSSQLMASLRELTTRNAEMRTLMNRYTAADPRVIEKRDEINNLEQQTIPTFAQAVLASLDAEGRGLSADIDRASTELRAIPTRTIEEQRLSRSVASATTLYTDISNRYETAKLAAASTVPDVSVWTHADVPQFPIPDQRLQLIAMVLGASFAIGILGAILLDRIDPRVQYPEQVTSELGLTILGAVPPIKRLEGRRGEENTEHVVEAFRELRLNLLYAYGSAGPGPLLITLSSPGSGDGKSLITANLGVAFAELGRKTLIIDGDTRRGDVHQLLGRRRKPGLTDYLAGESSRAEIIQKTEYESLDLISSGSRLTHAPELLGSTEMRDLFADLRTQYGVILVDSPPLGAGSDAFMLGTLTGNLVLILRTGTTNRELTQARLGPLTRLPVRILGAILNDVQPDGIYRYYSSYLPGYGTSDEDSESTARPAALQGATAP